MRESFNSKRNLKLSLFALFLGLSTTLILCSCSNERPILEGISTTTLKAESTKLSQKEIEDTNTPMPTPTGSFKPMFDFTCINLEKHLAISDLVLDTDFFSEVGSPELRAISSGGSTCKWKSISEDRWISISVEKLSPEDYRDFAASLVGLNSLADFGSKNDSVGYFSFDGTIASAKVLNTSYLITARSNIFTNQNEIGKFAIKAENLYVGD